MKRGRLVTGLLSLVLVASPVAVTAAGSTDVSPTGEASSKATANKPTDDRSGGNQTDDGGKPDTETEPIPFGFDFVPFLGTSSSQPYARRVVSVNLIGGISGGIEAAEFAGVLNLTRGSVNGAQIAGAANFVFEDIQGVQGAGALNIAGGDLTGVQLAGSANIAGGDGGSQLAGALNIIGGDFQGVQLAGAANIAGGTSSGVQGAGALNISGKAFEGLQASGAANITAGDFSGAQLGTVNIATGEVEGLQLGVVNIAEDSTASIGVVSILTKGFVDIEAFGSEEGLVMTGVRHGGDHVYNVYAVGFRAGDQGTYPTTALGIGFRHEFSDALEFSTDIMGIRQFQQNFQADDNGVGFLKLRPLLGWRPNKYIGVFGGPTLTFSRAGADATEAQRATPPWGSWELRADDPELRLWPGFTLGVRIL